MVSRRLLQLVASLQEAGDVLLHVHQQDQVAVLGALVVVVGDALDLAPSAHQPINSVSIMCIILVHFVTVMKIPTNIISLVLALWCIFQPAATTSR